MAIGLEVLFKQFLKNFGEPPGWVPLLITSYIFFALAGIPSSEVLAGVVTVLLYQFGDALDEWIYKDRSRKTRGRFDKQYSAQRNAAKALLNIDGGVRDVALKLATAADKAGIVNRQNEFAKFVRSLVLPFAVLVLMFLFSGQPLAVVPAVGGLLISVYLYLWFKVAHLRNLYELVPELVRNNAKYKSVELGGIKFFFWDGTLVASAIKA